MASKAQASSEVHVVCIPSPFQSHIKAMLKLAKLLHHKGSHITFVNTEFNHRRFLQSGGAGSLDGLRNFQFDTIPDGLPQLDDMTDEDILSLGESIRNGALLEPFRNLLAKHMNDDNKSAQTSWMIISDGFMPFTTTAAEEFGIPVILFFTISACSLMGFKQFGTLKQKGILGNDERYLTKEYLDTVIDWIPGMNDIRIRDLPTFARSADPNDTTFNLIIQAMERASKASAIIIHSFDALERQVLDALSSMFSHVLAIGPLQLLLNQIHQDQDDPLLNSIGLNLWKEETECFHWLQSKEPNSVIYVNFGSFIFLTKQQLIEFGMGLANSSHPFLWIIRPDLVIGEFPSEFVEEITLSKEKGFIASWCPQEEVLNHPSIGGFITHSGWNSTIESLSAGVPLICWPFCGDQLTNCRYTCNEWNFGLEITSGADVKRTEVEKLVRELMGPGEKGKELKNKALEWKRMAEEATAPGGSSSVNLEKVVNQFLLSRDYMSPKN